MEQYAQELYFCPCGGEVMKLVNTATDELAVGNVKCYKCGMTLGHEHFDEAYAADENGRITE